MTRTLAPRACKGGGFGRRTRRAWEEDRIRLALHLVDRKGEASRMLFPSRLPSVTSEFVSPALPAAPIDNGWQGLLRGLAWQPWSEAQERKLRYYLNSNGLETGGLEVWTTLVSAFLAAAENEALLLCLRTLRAKVREAIGLLREWNKQDLPEWEGSVLLGTHLGLLIAQRTHSSEARDYLQCLVAGAPMSELKRMSMAEAAPEVVTELIAGPLAQLASSGSRLLAKVDLNTLSPMAFALAWLRWLAVATILWPKALSNFRSERSLRVFLAGLLARGGVAARERARARFPLEMLLAEILVELRVPLAEPDLADAHRITAILRAALLQSQPEDFRTLLFEASTLLQFQCLVWGVAAVHLMSPLLLHAFWGLGSPERKPPWPYDLRSQALLEIFCTALCAEYPRVLKVASEDFPCAWLMVDVLAHYGAEPEREWRCERDSWTVECMSAQWWQLKARLRDRGLGSPAAVIALLRAIERAATLLTSEPGPDTTTAVAGPQQTEPAPPKLQAAEPVAAPAGLGSLLRRDSAGLVASAPGSPATLEPALGLLLEQGSGGAWPCPAGAASGAAGNACALGSSQKPELEPGQEQPVDSCTSGPRQPVDGSASSPRQSVDGSASSPRHPVDGGASSPLQPALARGKRLRACNKRLAREQKRLQGEVDGLAAQQQALGTRVGELRGERAELLAAVKGLRKARLGLATQVTDEEAKLRRLQRATEQEEAPLARVCDICEEGPRPPAVFVPCGHARACGECAAEMRECPFCRRVIQTVVVPI